MFDFDIISFERLARFAPHSEVLAAPRTMDDAKATQVPVIEGNEIVGILSREQVLHRIRLRSELGESSQKGVGYATLQEHPCSH